MSDVVESVDGLSVKPKLSSVERLLSAENLKLVIRQLFLDAVIINTSVKKGAKSSSNIYVHKRFEGRKVTVIVWA